MYETLKELLSQASIFYGPVTKSEAFNVACQSWAAPVNDMWYIGTNEPVQELEALEIKAPV